MADRNQEGLNNIIEAINNIVEPKISNSKFDRTFRAKVIEKTENEDYIVQINNINYTLKYAGKLEPNQIVRVKAPLNNFSDIYIEPLPGSGGGSGSTDNYNDLVNKPILETDISENLVPDKDELIKGTIKLHKISKTGDYGDLNNKPELNFVPETEKASANGVATLGSDKKVITEQLPIASTSKLGVIKAGENVVIAEDGTLSAIGGSGGTISDTLPIGSVVVWYSDIIPTNWLLLNGQEVSRTEYAELFAIYGTKYGAGDGSTTFNLPDRRKRFGLGKSSETPYDELGNTGGEETHKLIKTELPAERLKVIDSRYLPSRELQVGSWATEGNTYPGIRVNENEGSGFLTTENMGSGTPMNNMPPYIVENYIVKAKQTVATVAAVIDNLTSTSGTDALSANMGRILDTKVSISEAPPETSNVAKLWVDTSPILTGGNPDLLYNGSESEDWNSLLTPLKNKIFEAYFSSSTYTGSAILGYGDTVIDTTGGRVTASSNGLIKINYNGNVRIKAQFWVKADSNARPWTRLEDYDNNRVTLISSIDDMPSGYLTVTIEKIVPNSGVHNYDISVGLSTGGMTINGDSGSDVNSILIVELL